MSSHGRSSDNNRGGRKPFECVFGGAKESEANGEREQHGGSLANIRSDDF